MKPKRVVVFGPGLQEMGGMQKRTRLLIGALESRGWEVRVLARTGTSRTFSWVRTPTRVALEVPGFRSRRLGAVLYLLIAIPLGVVWSLRARSLMAIHLSSPTLAAASCSLITGKPFIALTTSSGTLSEMEHVRSGALAPVRLSLIGRARWLVAQTGAGAAELRHLVPPERIRVLPSPVEGVDPPPLTGALRAACVGRISEEKDLPTVLAAWRSLPVEFESARLSLVGAGGAYRSVETEIREMLASDRHLRDSVMITGWVDDVGRYWREADVFILASRSEGMSNALLEACSWGRVVVASDIPPNRELLGEDYPLLFRVGDHQDLRRCLEAAFKDPELRRRARQVAMRRSQRHALASVAADLDEMLTGAFGGLAEGG